MATAQQVKALSKRHFDGKVEDLDSAALPIPRRAAHNGKGRESYAGSFAAYRYLIADDVPAALSECGASPQRAAGGWKRGTTVALGLAAAFLLVAATLISIKTGAGTLVLEVNQPDVSVTIDGEKVTIHSPRDQVEVRVGKHEMEVNKEGFHTSHAAL